MCSYFHRWHSHHSEECSLMRWALVHRIQGLCTDHFNKSLSQSLTRVPLVSFPEGIFLECSDSHAVVSNSETPWTVAHQAPLSTGFSKQEHWSGLPFPYPRDLPNQESNPGLLHCMKILYRLSYREASPCDLRQVTQPQFDPVSATISGNGDIYIR